MMIFKPYKKRIKNKAFLAIVNYGEGGNVQMELFWDDEAKTYRTTQFGEVVSEINITHSSDISAYPVSSVEYKVIKDIVKRAQKGYLKYGKTMDRKDFSLKRWLKELRQELMDAALYCRASEKKKKKKKNGK